MIITTQKITLAEKAKFSIKSFFSKCDQIRIAFLMKNFIFCAAEVFRWYFLS